MQRKSVQVTLGRSIEEFSPTLNHKPLTHAHLRVGEGHVPIPIDQLDEVIGWLTEAKHEAVERARLHAHAK